MGYRGLGLARPESPLRLGEAVQAAQVAFHETRPVTPVASWAARDRAAGSMNSSVFDLPSRLLEAASEHVLP